MDKYVIAKYIRLSMDDAITESLSIPNQHLFLDEYISNLDIDDTQVLEFVDNGFSGTNFERPAVDEMLALVQKGGIDCIVCKDFSRFGRNATETGYFIDQVFPIYQVRFISVDDGFDSNNYKEDTGGIEITFKYLLHERYSRDLSKKVKSARRTKMASGENIVANAIYGYRKGDSGKWEEDSEAASVVRRIYQMSLEGLSPAKIRDEIFADHITTPQEYISMKRGADIVPSCMWTARMINHILSNEQYTGMYISGKQESKAIGSHSKIRTDKKDWIMIPDMHPPIVSKEMFCEAQEKLQKYRKGHVERKPREFLLRSKVACGCCRYALSYDAIYDPVFRCHHTQADPSAECHKMKVNARELDDVVLLLMESQIQVMLGCTSSNVKKVQIYEQRISGHEELVRGCVGEQQRIYEQYLEKEVSREEYRNSMQINGVRLEKLNQQLVLLKGKKDAEQARQRVASIAKDLVNELASPRELVETLVNKVYVFPDNRIEIDWLIADFTL